MPVFTVTCPDCRALLRSKAPIPAGKKIKCPTCSTVFSVPAEADAEPADGISAGPLPPLPVARRQARVVEAEEEDEAPPDDYEEEEEVEERPRKRKKARRAKHAGGGGQWLLIGGLAAGLLLVLGGGGVVAYFLCFYGINRGTGDEDPLAYVPPQTNLVMGIDYAALLNDPVLGPQLETSFKQQGGSAGYFDEVKKQSGLEVKELFARAVIGMDMNFSQGGNPFRGTAMPGGMAASGIQVPTTLILRPSRPFNQRKIAQASKNAVHKSYGGLAYYEINDGGFKTLFMPSDRTIVLSSLDIQQMGPLFAAGGARPNLSAGMATMIRSIEKNTLWMAVPFEGDLRQKIDAGLAQNPPPADLKDLVDALSKSAGMAVWGNLEGNRVKLGLGISCADAAAAAHTTELVKDWWARQDSVMNRLRMLAFPLHKTSQLYRELTGSLRFATAGTMAEVTAEVGRQGLGEAVTGLQKMPANGQPGGPRADPRSRR